MAPKAAGATRANGEPVFGVRPAAVSMRDVAKRAGVSIATISRVLNNEASGVSDETRSRVRLVIEELQYRPNHIGRALRAQRTDTYALVISNIQNTFYAAIAWELERQLNDLGRVMLLFNTNESPALQDRCLEEISSRKVSGLLILCAVESKHLQAAVADNPTVFINRRILALGTSSFVGIDEYAAARDLTTAMLRTSERPIGLIHGPLYSDTSARRFAAVRDMLREGGAAVEPEDVREARLSMDSGYQCAVDLFGRKRYRLLFCGSDQIAYGAFRRSREIGLSVPEDVRIYGFDDNPLNEWLAPWLNTVRVPHVALATEALRQLELLRQGGPHREVTLPYEIVLRV